MHGTSKMNVADLFALSWIIDHKPNAIVTLKFGPSFGGNKTEAINIFFERAHRSQIKRWAATKKTRRTVAIGEARLYNSISVYHMFAKLDGRTGDFITGTGRTLWKQLAAGGALHFWECSIFAWSVWNNSRQNDVAKNLEDIIQITLPLPPLNP